MDALLVGKWTLGHVAKDDMTIVVLEFADRPPLHLALPRVVADGLASALREQLDNPPPPRNRLS